MTSCSYHASKDAAGSCVTCGKLICIACQSEIDGKSYCPPCVEKLFTASEAKAQATLELAAAKPEGRAVNPAWWLLPVFLSLVGGLAAWLANKEHNAGMARYMLFTGIGVAAVQGLVGLIIVVVLMAAPPAVKPGQKPPDPVVVPNHVTLRAQPDDLKIEETKIDSVVKNISASFKAKDVEAALKYFQEKKRDKYRKIFSQSPDIMPKMAADLEKAKIDFLSFKSNQYSRTAEYLIKSGGKDFSIVFINIDGQWVLEEF